METTFAGWLDFVQQWVALAGAEPVSASVSLAASPAPRTGPAVLMFSPHPDDECLVGALPLRLQQECGAHVINVAVTLGHAHQQQRRRREVEAACALLGFDLLIPQQGQAFLNVSPEVRHTDPAQWEAWCAEFAAILQQHRPVAVFAPHGEDFHPAHIGVHLLAREALRRYLDQSGPAVAFFETEYWHPQAAPNLLVGVRPETEALLLQATACHAGEVERNPYHLRHPARMIDNVRRGSEVVMGRGTAGRRFAFGELYRAQWLFADGRAEVMPATVLEPAEPIPPTWLQK